MPELIVEPGRCIASPNQVLLLTVRHVKTRPDVRTWIITDGGLGTVTLPTFYEYHEVFLADDVARPRTQKVDDRRLGLFRLRHRLSEQADARRPARRSHRHYVTAERISRPRNPRSDSRVRRSSRSRTGDRLVRRRRKHSRTMIDRDVAVHDRSRKPGGPHEFRRDQD